MNTKRTIVMVLGVGALVSLVGTSSAQFISLDGITEPLLVQAKTNDVLLSADFEDASLKDVTAWMRKSNLNFVAEGQVMQSGKKVSLHFKDTPGKDVIESVASAFGLSASKKGDVYVLNSDEIAPVAEIEVAPEAPESPAVAQTPSTPTAPEAPGFGFNIPDAKELDETIAKAMAEVDQAMQDSQKEVEAAAKVAEQAARDADNATDLQAAKAAAHRAADAARKAVELVRKSHRGMMVAPKALMEMGKLGHMFQFDGDNMKRLMELEKSRGGKGKTFVFTDKDKKSLMDLEKFGKTFQFDGENFKRLKELEKAHAGKGQAFMFDGKDFKSLQDMEKAFPKMKEFKFDKKALEEMKKAGKEMKGFKFDGKAFEELKNLPGGAHAFTWGDAKSKEEFFKAHPEMKNFKFDGMHLGLNGKTIDVKALVNSLTADQKKLMKDRGYLKLSDLDQKQKDMLGNPKGSFNLSIHNGDLKLKIRSDDSDAEGTSASWVSI